MADIKKTARHGAPKYQDSPEHAKAGYETLDAQAGATYRAGFYILGTMFAVAALLVPAYRFLVHQEARSQRPPANVIGEAPKPREGAFPRLVTSEPAVLADHLRKEDELLESWGWVEKDRGIARMPVDEAIRIIGERGALPAFPAPPAPDAPAGAPGASPSPDAAKPEAGGRP
jgi:hypothetical protein